MQSGVPLLPHELDSAYGRIGPRLVRLQPVDTLESVEFVLRTDFCSHLLSQYQVYFAPGGC